MAVQTIGAPAPVTRSTVVSHGTPQFEAGRVRRLRLPDEPRHRYYLYLPRHLVRPVSILVSVHGISRNAREHAEAFAPLAERWGVAVVAPRFGGQSFRGYQRVRLGRDGEAPDALLDRIITDVERRIGAPAAATYLFGYSGGGQFVHRYMMLHPERVAGVVVGAAGWFTRPDPRSRFPHGTAAAPGAPQGLDAGAFLRVPAAVIVGTDDAQRDAVLNQSRRVDHAQGTSRYERGQRWIGEMQAAALIHGLDTRYRFYTMPGVGHDFGRAMDQGRMGELAMRFLFGEPKRAGDDAAEVHTDHPRLPTILAEGGAR